MAPGTTSLPRRMLYRLCQSTPHGADWQSRWSMQRGGHKAAKPNFLLKPW